MAAKAIVLDANTLIRATLGVRARKLICEYSTEVDFLVPLSGWLEAEKHLALLAASQLRDPEKLIQLLHVLAAFVNIQGEQCYESWKNVALSRLEARSSRLAHFGLCLGSEVPDLDGGCRFLWMRSSYLDIGSS